MLEAFLNAFKIPDLKRRILFTLALLAVYRIGCHVPTPGVDGHVLSQFIKESQGTLLGLFDLFAGGSLSRATIFALGIMPYISASIIMQLLAAVFPYLQKLSKDEEGRKKITQYTRYGTVALCAVQSLMLSTWLSNPGSFGGRLVVPNPGLGFKLLTMVTLTTGTTFIMWLGEQISERGIGNGISLIIFTSIISSGPVAFQLLIQDVRAGTIKPFIVLLLLVLMLGVIAAVVALTQGQRRIPVQYAKRIVGRRMFGGGRQYLPLRVNQAGVIPIIFAASLLMFPATIAGFAGGGGFMQNVVAWFSPGAALYNVSYVALIVFFTYFYTAITFNPMDVSDNLKKYGGFIPGIRPGPPTREYLERIMDRITLPGAFALAGVAVLPTIISSRLKVSYMIASFFGGTSLLIIVGVALDTVKQIESRLLMRHYDGFMKKGKIRARR